MRGITLKLLSLFEAQERLDSKIVQVHGLQGKNLTADVTSALYVELGELQQEIAYFKYWKKHKNINKERQWDEWADCLHFLLSLGNRYGHSNEISEIEYLVVSESDIPSFHILFQHLYQTDFTNVLQYSKALTILTAIGYFIGMTEKDMEDSYFAKNKVNYERLENNY